MTANQTEHLPTLMPWADISRVLNMSRRTVCKIHNRALRKIKKALQREPDNDELLAECGLRRREY